MARTRLVLAGVASALLLSLLGAGAAHAAPVAPWSNVQTLSTANQLTNDHVSIAITPDGTHEIAFWQSNDSFVATLKSASAVIAGGVAVWGATTVVETIPWVAQGRPVIALSDDGQRATAVWHSSSGGNDQIRVGSASISGTVQAWGTPSTAYESTPGRMAEVPDIALSAAGDLAVVAWYALSGTQYVTMSRAAGIAGTTQNWEASEQTMSGMPADWNAFSPSVAISDDGTKSTLVYYGVNGSGDGTVESRSATIVPGLNATAPTVTWASAQNLVLPGPGGTSDASVALSADGSEAWATWSRTVGPLVEVQASHATIAGNAATWNGTGTTVSDPLSNAWKPQLATSSNGLRAVVVWEQSTSPQTQEVRARLGEWSGASMAWQSPATLSASEGWSAQPEIAVSSDGYLATAVWGHAGQLGGVQVVEASNYVDDGATSAWSAPAVISPETAAPISDFEQSAGSYLPQVSLSSDGHVAMSGWTFRDGTDYSVQVVRANGTCTQSWDGSTLCLPGAPTQVGALPGDGSATVAWTPPADPFAYGITGYAYEVVDQASSTVIRTWTQTGSAAPSVLVTGLANGVTYTVNVRAINNYGWSATAGSTSAFTPSAPPRPASAESTQATPGPAAVAPAPAQTPAAAGPSAVAGKPDNPPAQEVVAPGLTLVAAQIADSTPARTVRQEPTQSLGDAPRVTARRGQPVSLVVQGLAPGTLYQVKAKVDGSYVSLGSALTDANGLAQLPVFRSTALGVITIALVDPASGTTSYLKVHVTARGRA